MSQPVPPVQNWNVAPAPMQKTNTLAIVGFICSLIGISIPGVIKGHIDMSQIKNRGECGRGLALAALILGYVWIAIEVIWIIIAIAVVGTLASS